MSAVSITGHESAAVARELALRGALGQLEREFGKGTLMRMGDPGAQVHCEAIPTGALSLDLALGIGGIVGGDHMIGGARRERARGEHEYLQSGPWPALGAERRLERRAAHQSRAGGADELGEAA